jgi:hypothetical protein
LNEYGADRALDAMTVAFTPPLLETVKAFSTFAPFAIEPKSNVGPSLIARTAAGAPVPCIGRVDVCAEAPLLYESEIVSLAAPSAVGANVTMTLHDAPAFKELPHVPPEPGNDPPLNENGAVRAAGETPVAVRLPELVIVNVLSFEAVTTTAPKSYVVASLIVIEAGRTPVP